MTDSEMTSNLAVRRIVERLEQAGIAYMLTGSLASSYWGKPRGTQDLNIVVAPTIEPLQALLEALAQDDCYVDDESARSAFRRKAQFNVLDVRTGWKIDLIFRRQRLFSETEMNRAQIVEVDGTRLWLASPEDVVIAKLE